MTRNPRSCAAFEEPLERPHRAVIGVHDPVVGDVVPVVAQRRRVERQQPDRGDPELDEVVELRREPVEVAGAVGVRVAERPHVHLVDDRVLEPSDGGLVVRCASSSRTCGSSLALLAARALVVIRPCGLVVRRFLLAPRAASGRRA
jgi:hypothetical protein